LLTVLFPDNKPQNSSNWSLNPVPLNKKYGEWRLFSSVPPQTAVIAMFYASKCLSPQFMGRLQSGWEPPSAVACP
jgi:hypothetical protein